MRSNANKRNDEIKARPFFSKSTRRLVYSLLVLMILLASRKAFAGTHRGDFLGARRLESAKLRSLDESFDLFPFRPGFSGDFALRLHFHQMLALVVSSDLDSARPRPEIVDDETYFSVGIEVPLHDGWSLYTENFMPTNAVLGGPFTVEREGLPSGGLPDFVWDGHQLALGIIRRAPRYHFKVAPVFYVLSKYRRDSSVGLLASLTWTF